MTISVGLHSMTITKVRTQLFEANGLRWRTYTFTDENDVLQLELTCYMPPEMEDIEVIRLQPRVDMSGVDEVESLSEAPVG